MTDDKPAVPAPTAAIVRPIVSALVDCSLPDFLSFVREFLTGFERAGLWCDYHAPDGRRVRLDRVAPPVIRLNKRQTRATIAQDALFVDAATGEPVATVNPVLKGVARARGQRTEYRLAYNAPVARTIGTDTLRECYRQLPWEIGRRFDVTDLTPLGWWGLAALPPFEPPGSPAIDGAAQPTAGPEVKGVPVLLPFAHVQDNARRAGTNVQRKRYDRWIEEVELRYGAARLTIEQIAEKKDRDVSTVLEDFRLMRTFAGLPEDRKPAKAP